jgi:putative NADH-flavin reductase
MKEEESTTQDKPRIAVLGATGRTGRWIVEEALRRGYAVNALVRDKSRLAIQHDDLSVIVGTPESKNDLTTTMAGCEAVLSALNISRVHEWWLWSKLTASPTFLSEVAQKVVEVATEMNTQCCLVVTAWGTSETKKDLPAPFRWMIDMTQIGITYQDHERQERVWEKSGLDWTIIRPVGLTNSTEEKSIQIKLDTSTSKPAMTISRRMVALFMLDALEQGTYTHQMPIISYL